VTALQLLVVHDTFELAAIYFCYRRINNGEIFIPDSFAVVIAMKLYFMSSCFESIPDSFAVVHCNETVFCEQLL
jgi:hypothetical protein